MDLRTALQDRLPRTRPRVRSRAIARVRGFLRLRGRFRGRRGVVAFLAVMGPGLIAGIAGNDAGGMPAFLVAGAAKGVAVLWVVPVTPVILGVLREVAGRLGAGAWGGRGVLARDRGGARVS